MKFQMDHADLQQALEQAKYRRKLSDLKIIFDKKKNIFPEII